MRRENRSTVILGPVVLALSLFGCGGAGSTSPNTTVGPLAVGGPVVTVALAGVTLGVDYSSGRSGGSCATNVPDCGGQQSNVQLKVSATKGTGNLPLQIVNVRILDQNNGQQLDQLTARAAQKWSGSAYVDWDQQIAPLVDFAASYKLSAPNWSVLSPSGNTKTTYRVEVDLLIGGETRTIGLDGVSREPPIAT
jgi:hypothetical protein